MRFAGGSETETGVSHMCRFSSTVNVLVYRNMLTKLPLELITEILMELEWRDILRVRSTSRSLSEASRSLILWHHLLKVYTRSSPIPLQLESPLEEHSQRDLEIYLFRRIGADLAWKQNNVTPSCQRTIGSSAGQKRYLIEGGRWLLIIHRSGFVQYHDLDAPTNGDAQDLISEPHCPFKKVSMCSCIELLTGEPNLSFNLVMCQGDRIPMNSSGRYTTSILTRIIRISRIGSGLEARLKAEVLVSHLAPGYDILHNLDFYLTEISLCGIYLTRSFRYCPNNSYPHTQIEIVEWRSMKRDDYNRRIIDGAPVCAVQLLPDNRLVLLSQMAYSIYDINHLKNVDKPTFAEDHAITSLQPIWRLEQSSFETATFLSKRLQPRVFRTPGSFVVMLYSYCFRQLVIPANWDISPYLRAVRISRNLEGEPGLNVGFGAHRALIYLQDSCDSLFGPYRPLPAELLTLEYFLPHVGKSDLPAVSKGRCVASLDLGSHIPSRRFRTPLLDESTGRVVMVCESPIRAGKRTAILVVSDYGLYVP